MSEIDCGNRTDVSLIRVSFWAGFIFFGAVVLFFCTVDLPRGFTEVLREVLVAVVFFLGAARFALGDSFLTVLITK